MSTEQPSAMSVPVYRRDPPRALTDREQGALVAVADVLIASAGGIASPSQQPEYPVWLDRALAARRDVFDALIAATTRLSGVPTDLATQVRELADQDPTLFYALSAVLVGAFLMIPAVRREINYPGQERKHPRFDEAAEEILDGILDPVIERGQVYRSV